MDNLYPIAAIASALAAVLAWVAKIYWSKEHIAAKDETIRAKEAQITLLEREIDGLRELTPMKIREYFTSVKNQLEEYNDSLKTQLEEARQEISEKQSRIDALRDSGSQQKGEIEMLTVQKSSIEEKANNLEGQLSALRKKHEGANLIWVKIPRLDPKALEQITILSRELRNSLTRVTLPDIAELSASIRSSMSMLRDLEKLKMPNDLLSDESEDSRKAEDKDKESDGSNKGAA